MLNPTGKRGTKTAYTKFRKALIAHGFTMIQSEVFMAVYPRRRSVQRALHELAEDAPSTGTVIALVLTERQFNSALYLSGGPSYQERVVGAKSQVIL